jgi:hypothetical protein
MGPVVQYTVANKRTVSSNHVGQSTRVRELRGCQKRTFLFACLHGKHALELFLFFVKGLYSRNGPGPGAIVRRCLSLLEAIFDG